MNRKNVTAIVVILILAALGYAYWTEIKNALIFMSDVEALTEMARNTGTWGIVGLIALLILQVFLAFIPGQALMAASGLVYGFWGGTLVTWFGLTLGGQMAFWLSRRFGRPFVLRFVEADVLARWDKTAAGQGILFYVITLLIPFFPNDAMCYVGGMSKISPRRFLLANALGRFIASSSMAFLGAYGAQIPVWAWVAIVLLVVTATLGWHLRKRFSTQNNKGDEKWYAIL